MCYKDKVCSLRDKVESIKIKEGIRNNLYVRCNIELIENVIDDVRWLDSKVTYKALDRILENMQKLSNNTIVFGMNYAGLIESKFATKDASEYSTIKNTETETKYELALDIINCRLRMDLENILDTLVLVACIMEKIGAAKQNLK